MRDVLVGAMRYFDRCAHDDNEREIIIFRYFALHGYESIA